MEENADTGGSYSETYYDAFEVVDGDTIKFQSGTDWQYVRLIGIDAPESTKHRYGYTQCYGEESSENLVYYLSGRSIRFMYDENIGMYDPYDRMLAYIITDSGDNVNTLMVQNGHAWLYDNDHMYHKEYAEYQEQAKEQGLGLWSACSGLFVDSN